jgi:hypothetical protein
MAGSLTVVCNSLLVLCHGSVVGPSTPFLGTGGFSIRDAAVWLVPSLWCVTRCSCYGTAAWLGPAPPFRGAGGSSVGNSVV